MGRVAKNPMDSSFFEDLYLCARFYGYDELDSRVMAARLVVTDCHRTNNQPHTGDYARMFVTPHDYHEAWKADVMLDMAFGLPWPGSIAQWAEELGIAYPTAMTKK